MVYSDMNFYVRTKGAEPTARQAGARSGLPGLALALLILLMATTVTGTAGRASGQEVVALGVNVRGDGSIPSPLGSPEPCLQVSVGEIFDVDVYVSNVVKLFSWELPFIYNPSILEVTQHDVFRFLAANPGSAVISASEPTPDRDGLLFLGAADIGNDPETGSGVLARITLRARSPGVSPAKVVTIDFNGDGLPDLGPRLTAADGDAIGDAAGDGYMDGLIHEGVVAVDVDCDAATTAPPPGDQPPEDQPPGEPSPSGPPLSEEPPSAVAPVVDSVAEIVEELLASTPPSTITDSRPATAGIASEGGGPELVDTDGETDGGLADGAETSNSPDENLPGGSVKESEGDSWFPEPLTLVAILAATLVVGGALAVTFVLRDRTRG